MVIVRRSHGFARLCTLPFARARSELEEQGDQLRRIRRKVDETDAHIERGNWILRGMKSWFGRRGKAPELPSEVVAKRESERAGREGKGRSGRGDAEAPRSSGSSRGGGGSGGVAAGGQAQPQAQAQQQRPGSGGAGASAAAHADADALLESLSGSLTRVKGQAVAIRDELASQDGVLDDVGAGVEKVRGKVDRATATAKRLAS